MSDKISQKIDNYARAHLSELKKRETGYVSITKQDVALEMYSQGLLSASDYSLWLSSTECQPSRDISLSIWGVSGEDGYLDSLGDSFERTTPPIPQVIPVTPSEQPQVSLIKYLYQYAHHFH